MKTNEFRDLQNQNESISDSLYKTIERYDSRTKLSVHNFWHKIGPEHELIKKLRELMRSGQGGFLERDWELMKRIKIILNERRNYKENEAIKNALDYLEIRVAYLDLRQHRSVDELDSDYKVLLVGDGWATRSYKNNPIVRMINQLDDERDKEIKAQYQAALNLENRHFSKEEVYTIDHNPAQLPDLCCEFQDLRKDDLPTNFFNVVYFEGMVFQTNEETENAVELALSLLKDDGLLIYSTSKPDPKTILMAKSGEITQDKLKNLPEGVKESIARQFHTDPLDRVVEPGAKAVVLIPKTESNIYEEERRLTPL